MTTNIDSRRAARPAPGTWAASAACVGADPDLFFTDRTGRDAQAVSLQAKTICAGCAVRDACLDHALEHGEPEGVWGGCTPAERRELARGRRPAACLECGGPLPEGSRRVQICSEGCRELRHRRQQAESKLRRRS